MQKNRFITAILIAAAILSGCNSMPQNPALAEAHSSYDSARSDPQVASLAAVELTDASNSLSKADAASSKGASASTVNQMAYIAKQKVAIAQETARRKTAEQAVANASAKRDQLRLEARTDEADEARQQVMIARENSAQQSAALAAAGVNAEQSQLRLEAKTAEADAANKQVAAMQETAGQQTAALAAASASAERDQALIAQQEMQLNELNAKKTKRGMVITLGDVLFSSNKAQMKSGGMRNLQKLADFLKQYPHRKVLVEGYTDSSGSDQYNQKLSEKRANTVRAALVDVMEVSGDRVLTRGYGKEFPVASNDTATGRQLNRRVEIIISDDNGKIAPR